MASTEFVNFVFRGENKLSQTSRAVDRSLKKTERAAGGLQSQLQKTAAAVRVVDGPLGGVASRISAFGTLTSKTTIAVAAASVAITGLGVALKRVIGRFAQFETANLTSQQIIRATGGAAGKTVEQIEALAEEIGFTTLAMTQGVRKAANQLLTFKSIAGETFDRTLRLSQDLAAVGFGTIQTAAVQLAKALEDPATGLTMLRRIGVSFTRSQRDMILAMHETGRVAAAQGEILKTIERQVGGAGVAAGSGLSGAFDGLTEASGRLVEKWGEAIAKGLSLQSIVQGLANRIRAMTNEFGPEQELNRVRESIERNRGARSGHALRAQKSRLRREAELVEVLARREQQRIDAQMKAERVQTEMRRQRVLSVQAELEKQIKLAKLTDIQRTAMKKVAEAGVEPGSAEAKKITALVQKLEDVKAAQRAVSTGALAIKTNFDDAAASTNTAADVIGASVQKVNGYMQQAANVSNAVGGVLSSTFDRWLDGTEVKAKEVFASILREIARVQFQANVLQPLFGGPGSNPPGGGVVGNLLSSFFGGFRADGGPVAAGNAYVVGERGPEVFVPRMAGSIIPNTGPGRQASGTTSINVTVNLDGAKGDKEIEAMAHQAALAGTARALRDYDRKLPARITDIERRYR